MSWLLGYAVGAAVQTGLRPLPVKNADESQKQMIGEHTRTEKDSGGPMSIASATRQALYLPPPSSAREELPMASDTTFPGTE